MTAPRKAVPTWAERQGFAGNAEVTEGAELFAVSGCLQCHLYLGTGSVNLGAPDLTAIGATGKGKAYFQRYVGNPAEFGNTIMQPYAGLGEDNLQKIAAFLDASKGPKDN